MLTSHSIFAASGRRAGINSSSWSILYGYTPNVNKQNYKPVGQSYKFQFGNRWDNNIEINFLVRYASQKDDINFSNIGGSISRTDLTAGMQFGYWLFLL